MDVGVSAPSDARTILKFESVVRKSLDYLNQACNIDSVRRLVFLAIRGVDKEGGESGEWGERGWGGSLARCGILSGELKPTLKE